MRARTLISYFMITGILFDIDGTLLDSNDAHANAWVDTLKEFNFAVKYEDVRTKIGMGTDNLLPALIGIEKNSKQGEALAKRRGEIFAKSYLPLLKPFPGARDLLLTLKKAGYKLVVATSASKQDLKNLLKLAKVDDLFEEKTNSDDVANSKPDPDIILAAMKKIEVEPQQAIMIGDTPYDIEAANKAMVKTIGFTCGGWSPDSLRDAIEIYLGPQDLLENLNSSILRHTFQTDSAEFNSQVEVPKS